MNLGPLDTPKMCLIVVTIQTHQNKRNLLPPANDIWDKVMFLHLSVILFTGGGVYPSMQWGRHPPDRHPPRQTTPPPQGRHPRPWANTPLEYYAIRSTSGRYSSYWNAYLLYIISDLELDIVYYTIIQGIINIL